MEQIRNKGISDWAAGSMTPEHDYVVYGYGLDEDGNESTVLFQEKFTTLSAPSGIIEMGEIGYTEYTFSIKTGEYPHVFYPVKKGLYEMGGYSDAEYLAIFGIRNFGDQTYNWVNGEELTPGYVMEVSPNTDYLILAAISNEQGTSFGPIERVDFTTPAKPTIDGAAEVNITDVTVESATINVTPADNITEYIVFWKEMSWHNMVLDGYGEGVLVSTIKAAVDQGLASKYTGEASVSVAGLLSATEYVAYVLAFGDDGSETLVTTPFTTL